MNKLLILTTRFNHNEDKIGATFIYDQVDQLRLYFDKVEVISFRPYLPIFVAKIMGGDRFRDSQAKDYTYKNVNVKYINNFILPFLFFKKKWIKNGFNSAYNYLKKKSFKPDIIHAHRTWPIAGIGNLLSKKFNIEYVVTAHGHDAYGLPFKNNYYKKTIKKSLMNSKKIISVSNKNLTLMSNFMNITKEKFEFIPNGFDSKKFFFTKETISKRKFQFLSVGLLHKIKGHTNLIFAFKKLLNKVENVELVIVGDGPEMKNIKSLVKKLSLSESVSLLGVKPHDEIPTLMRSCDFFVLPSLNEGMPTVLFEALSCGKPVISTNVGGVSEIIINEKIGLLSEPNNINSLFFSMKKALSINWKSNYISKYASDYSWQKISKKINNLYKL